MAEPIADYHKLVFRTDDDADHACDLLMNYATNDAGSLVGPERIVMWRERLGGTGWDEHSLIDPIMTNIMYVSSGALQVLERLVPLPPSQIVKPSDLPKARMMMVGDALDWDWTVGPPNIR